MYILICLALSWVLKYIGFDDVVLDALFQLTSKEFNISVYYFMFFVLGAIFDIIHFLKD
jgi:hypothetical protein